MVSQVFNMDCMDGMKQYPDKYFDLAVVDPPYNIASQQARGVGSRIDKTGKMNSWNHKTPDADYFIELFRVSTHQIIWGANNYFGLPPTEYFCVWSKKQSVSNFASAEYAYVSQSLKKPAKVFEYGIHQHNADIDRIHPTQKPVKLYDWIYKNYLPNGGKVLDTHLGSGSNRIAADKAGNIDFIGYELDAEYYTAQEKRWSDYKKQLILF